MKRTKISRRAVLRGAGGIAIALPFLEAMEPSARAGTGAAKKLVVVFSPHGRASASNSKWRPSATGSAFELSEFMLPFAPFKDQLVVVSGLEMVSANSQSGNPHSKGATHALTCIAHAEELPGGTEDVMGQIGYSTGISVDQRAAQVLSGKGEYAFDSLQFGVQGGPDFAEQGATTRSLLSYAGPGEPLVTEDNPAAMFDRLFSDFGSDGAEIEALHARRRSILDFVADDFDRLTKTVGANDGARLEEHLTHLREIEESVGTVNGSGPSCGVPDVGPPIDDYRAEPAFPEVGRQQMLLLAMAMACDLTPVSTLQWSTGQSTTNHTWLPGGGSLGHHNATHQGMVDEMDAITSWYAQQVAALVGYLADADDVEGGSVLDHTVVLWVAGENAYPDTHTFDDMPYVVFGGGAGGQHLDFAGRASNDLMLTVLHALGIADATFGDPSSSTGPLPGLFT